MSAPAYAELSDDDLRALVTRLETLHDETHCTDCGNTYDRHHVACARVVLLRRAYEEQDRRELGDGDPDPFGVAAAMQRDAHVNHVLDARRGK